MTARKAMNARGALGAWAFGTRQYLDMSAEAVAHAAHVSPTTIRKIEGGSYRTPSAHLLRQIYQVFETRAAERGVTVNRPPGLVDSSEHVMPPADIGNVVAAIEAQTAMLGELVAAVRSLAAGRDAAAIPPDAGAEIEAAYQQALRSGYRPLQYEFDPTEDRETGEIDRRAE